MMEMEWYNDIGAIVELTGHDQGGPPLLTQQQNLNGGEIRENLVIESESDDNDDAGDSDESNDEDIAVDSDSEFVPSESESEQEDETYVVQPIPPELQSPPKKKQRGRPPGAKNINSTRGDHGNGHDANGADNICKICNKSFTAFSSLQRHIATTHSENTKRFSCEHCGKNFTQKPSLVTHVKNKHTGQFDFPCPHCKKKYVRNVELQNHIKYAHMGNTPDAAAFKKKCPECGKEFRHMARHMRDVHKSQKRERKNVCSICSKAFTERRDLNRHLGTHDDNKPYRSQSPSSRAQSARLRGFSKSLPCPHCPKIFYDKYGLNIHISRTHLVEKKYVSKYCGMKFVHIHYLKKHDGIHETLGICSKKLRTKIFACEYCEERTESEYLLETHMRKKHPKPRLVLQKMKVKDISLKENPESGLFLVRGEKEQGKDSGSSGHPWHLCLKCGHAFLDLNKARRHNNFCDVVPVSVAPAKNQSIQPETTTTTEENSMDEEETVPEPEPTIPNIGLDPDLPVTPTPKLGDKPQRVEPQIINSDDEEPMDYFDEAFGEDEVRDLNLSTIDEEHHSDATTGSIQTVEDSVEPEITGNSDKSNSNQKLGPVTSTMTETETMTATVTTLDPETGTTTESTTETTTEPTTATMTDPAGTASELLSLATILALPKGTRSKEPYFGRSSLPAELRATTPWQIEHMNVVLTAPKPFQCKTCLKFFGSKSGVKEHIKLHEEPKHCCAYCGKTFYKINVWRIHERTHTGEKPYKCKYCDWRTGDQNFMYIHERTHPESGKQPYKYPNTSAARQKVTCTVCNKTLNSARELKSHMYFQHEKVPSKGLPYTCTICKSTFAYRSNAVAHVKSTHSDQVKKVGATNPTSFFKHNFLLEDKSLLPPGCRPQGRAGDKSKESEEIDDDDSEFQDLSQVKIS